jgi:hypothetical protein
LTLSIGPGGPILDFLCGVSKPRAEALTKAKVAVPPYVAVRGLVDTGASITSFDSSILRQLGVVSKGTIQIHTPSTDHGKPHIANQYDVSVILRHPQATRIWQALPVFESSLSHQGIQALIGRDILNYCLLTYDGNSKLFALAF